MAVDFRETLITYLKSESMDEAAKNLNVTRATLQQRLMRLKKVGVNVPTIRKRTLGSLEIAQLNSIVKKWEKGDL